MKKINLQLAANDQVKLIEEKIGLYQKLFVLIILNVLSGWLGLTIQFSIILFIFIAYHYHLDLKEKKRLVEKYDL